MKDKLFIWMQFLLPHHLLSRTVAVLAQCRIGWVKNAFIGWFARRYQVDMSQAAEPELRAYSCFNDFFTRELRPDARPLAPGRDTILCPADGMVSQAGPIEDDQLLQAKGRYYSVQTLLGGDACLAEEFQGGNFATIYLSPKDYHRVHMPLGARLRETIYVPGQLFSVNQLTSERVDNLFARNERLVCLFDTDHGPMALVLVGAMIVAGIDTVWAGQAAPAAHGLLSTPYGDHTPAIELAPGSEMGRFRLGSTVIALFGPGMSRLSGTLQAGKTVYMGESIGNIVSNLNCMESKNEQI
ncbi:archaetidylserine decarboxylase [Pseudohongiella spirulinae]|uniref:Phosphatidylserine decarboxylase proenzyme n=1 Tax=Pseudohongiella spirulinae TaxID=1249552 RepID=A0A0S2K9P4_9GAMM|nr:archaetidylserine decarboxylase [Pseudohongiella spirulinae]ALO44798.1 Phosphatidylserine decarboxylase proenzyme [Pseudohongiella spirulinae]